MPLEKMKMFSEFPVRIPHSLVGQLAKRTTALRGRQQGKAMKGSHLVPVHVIGARGGTAGVVQKVAIPGKQKSTWKGKNSED